MRHTIIENEHLCVEEDELHRVIVLTRRNTRLRVPTEVATIYGELSRHLQPRHSGWGLLIDVRQAPGNNDVSFEGQVQSLIQDAERRFSRVVVLVSTAVGELQARRIGRDGKRPLLTRDPDEALALASGAKAS